MDQTIRTPEELYAEAEETFRLCVTELGEAGRLRPGAVVVLGCSTSEVAGERIGHGSAPAYGEALAAAMLKACRERQFQAVFQCPGFVTAAVFAVNIDDIIAFGRFGIHRILRDFYGVSRLVELKRIEYSCNTDKIGI